MLIADDSRDVRDLYSEYLRYSGFSVITAADGEAALDVALSSRPDVIVMDLAMPYLDGVAATRLLKHDPRTQRIPVILLTGHAMRAIEHDALEAGVDTFLTKPCLPEELEHHVKRALGPELGGGGPAQGTEAKG